MSVFIDKKFAGMISARLERFRWTGKETAQFRCPICGDSKKKKTKTRGGFYAGKDGLMVGCFNCNYQKPFGIFLKTFDPVLYKEYVFERFKWNNDHRWFHNRIEKQEKKIEAPPTSPLVPKNAIMNLNDDHIARKYIAERKIPIEFWNKLYYTDNFKKFINDFVIPDKFKNVKEPDPRIIIPFYNLNGIPFAYQGRSLFKNLPENVERYISINPNPQNLLIYGMDRLKEGKLEHVLEGPFDSMFLPNAVAVAGSGLQKLLVLKKLNPTFIFDNEPRNAQVCDNMEKIIDAGKNILIWPNTIKEKDINKMIENGYSIEKVLDIIRENTYNGITARIKFNEWKKI